MQREYYKSIFYLVLLMVILSPGCSTIQKITIDESLVTPYQYMKKNPDRWEDIVGNIKRGETVVVLIPEGTTIPLRSTVESTLFVLEDSEKDRVRFKRDVYIYTSKSKMLISPDGKRWAKIKDIKSIKELFGFSKGELIIGFGADKESEAFISLLIKTR